MRGASRSQPLPLFPPGTSLYHHLRDPNRGMKRSPFHRTRSIGRGGSANHSADVNASAGSMSRMPHPLSLPLPKEGEKSKDEIENLK